MKMEELKRKMEAHVAAEAEANKLRQVPPVTIQAPDLEQIKQSLSGKASSSKTNLSQLAAGMALVNEINLMASTFIIWRDVCVCSLRSHGCGGISALSLCAMLHECTSHDQQKVDILRLAAIL